MSSPLRIELRASRALPIALVLLALGAGAALWMSAWPRWTLLLAPLALAAAWPRRAPPWKELVLRADGSAATLDADGGEMDVVPLRLQRRGPLTVLTLRSGDRMHPWLFTPATLPDDADRRLGLWFARHADVPRNGSAVPHV